jgi:hypothetical protein
VYDQGQCGSCTSQSICQAVNILKTSDFAPSRLYLYTKERLIENCNSAFCLSDSGADAVDGLTWAATTGICPEVDWPYDTSKVEVAPPAQCDLDAPAHKIAGIRALDQPPVAPDVLLASLKSTIASGIPVLVGIQVYQSFMSDAVDQSGIVPMPDTSYEACVGGHEILLVGYDSTRQLVEFVNSWGSGWGDNGFGWLPEAYIKDSNLASELRCFASVIESVSDQAPAAALPEPTGNARACQTCCPTQ